MPTFVMLSTLGPEGAATLFANPERMLEVNREVEEMGVKVLHQWVLLGQYDFCTIIEAPDIETMSKVSLALGARGTLKTATMAAIPAERYVTILKG